MKSRFTVECQATKDIQLFGDSLKLENLFIQDCDALETIDLSINMAKLVNIDIRGCSNLNRFSYQSNMKCQLLRLESTHLVDVLQ